MEVLAEAADPSYFEYVMTSSASCLEYLKTAGPIAIEAFTEFIAANPNLAMGAGAAIAISVAGTVIYVHSDNIKQIYSDIKAWVKPQKEPVLNEDEVRRLREEHERANARLRD